MPLSHQDGKAVNGEGKSEYLPGKEHRDQIDKNAQGDIDQDDLGGHRLDRVQFTCPEVLRHDGRDGRAGLSKDPDNGRDEGSGNAYGSQGFHRINGNVADDGRVGYREQGLRDTGNNGRYCQLVDLPERDLDRHGPRVNTGENKTLKF